MFATLISAAVLMAAANTAPAGGTAAPAGADAKPKNKDMELVCWRETPAGTHFSKRVCTTRIERERMERQGQEAVGQHPRAAPGGAFGH